MPGFDPEIGKLAQRVLVNPRKIDSYTGVFASKVPTSQFFYLFCAEKYYNFIIHPKFYDVDAVYRSLLQRMGSQYK